MFNVPLSDMVRCAVKSISNGMAVWFACDVHQSFNWFLSSLDDELDEHHTVFGPIEKFDKGDRILMRNVQSCHAMALTGFNLDQKGKPVNWQVENSWGYIDSQTPGLDGFLNMSHTWFEKYVTQIVVHKNFLTRTLKNKLKKANVKRMDPWEAVSVAMKVKGVAQPKKYLSELSKMV
jgi:bleomycin hydrolase